MNHTRGATLKIRQWKTQTQMRTGKIVIHLKEDNPALSLLALFAKVQGLANQR